MCYTGTHNTNRCVKLTMYVILFVSDATVGLETESLEVNEDGGVAEVCVVVSTPQITCPIDFPFEINVHTHDSTASKTSTIHFESGTTFVV